MTNRTTLWNLSSLPQLEYENDKRFSSNILSYYELFDQPQDINSDDLYDDLNTQGGFICDTVDEDSSKWSCKAMKYLTADLYSSILSPFHCDVVFICKDGVKLPAHSLILYARCDYFKTLLSCGKTVLSVTEDISVNAVSAVLKYLYTGSLPCCDDAIYEIHLLAKRFGLDVLVDLCRLYKPVLSIDETDEDSGTFTTDSSFSEDEILDVTLRLSEKRDFHVSFQFNNEEDLNDISLDDEIEIIVEPVVSAEGLDDDIDFHKNMSPHDISKDDSMVEAGKLLLDIISATDVDVGKVLELPENDYNSIKKLLTDKDYKESMMNSNKENIINCKKAKQNELETYEKQNTFSVNKMVSISDEFEGIPSHNKSIDSGFVDAGSSNKDYKESMMNSNKENIINCKKAKQNESETYEKQNTFSVNKIISISDEFDGIPPHNNSIDSGFVDADSSNKTVGDNISIADLSDEEMIIQRKRKTLVISDGQSESSDEGMVLGLTRKSEEMVLRSARKPHHRHSILVSSSSSDDHDDESSSQCWIVCDCSEEITDRCYC